MRSAETVEGVEILEVARNQRRLAAERADLVVEVLERALRAGQRDHMGAPAGEFERDGAADAARGAGDEGDPAGERGCVGHDKLHGKVSAGFGQQRQLPLDVLAGDGRSAGSDNRR